jgi:pimeloyl-ACP methyl ester carboxylesterase
MVATGVADRAPDRVAHLIYLDAFVPRDGQSLSDLQSAEIRAKMKEGVRTSGDGWRVPPNPLPSDTSEADVEWITPRRVMQPLKTFEEPIYLSGTVEQLPKTYIYCMQPSPGNMFQQFARRASSEPGWHFMEIDSTHSPHITVPDKLAALLDQIAAGR